MFFYGGARIERLVFALDGIFVNEHPHFCMIDKTKEIIKHTCTVNANLPKNNSPLSPVVALNSKGNAVDSEDQRGPRNRLFMGFMDK